MARESMGAVVETKVLISGLSGKSFPVGDLPQQMA
jgi:hypothetical protein